MDEHLAFYHQREIYPVPFATPKTSPWLTKRTRILTGKWPKSLFCCLYAPRRGFPRQAFIHNNLGIRTGSRFHHMVIDVDSIPHGVAFINRHSLPETLMARTGQRGFHLYYRLPEKAPLIPSSHDHVSSGIDIRGEFSFVTAPPSLHGNGSRYEFINPSHPIAELPMATALHLHDFGPSPYQHIRKVLRNYRTIKVLIGREFLRHRLLAKPLPSSTP